MKIGSLFSGIGGLELGLEWAGVGRTVWQVEKDEFCQSVLARHWPDAKRYDDITEVDFHALEPVDVLCGGFPCQDISSAGKRAGIDGERSGLWSEYVRAIRVLRPRYVVVENVRALLVRGFGRVLGDLAESGYDAEWDCIPAAAVGAPHLRDRVFVIAWSQQRRAVADAGSGRGQDDGLRAGRDESRSSGAHVAHSDASGRYGRSWELRSAGRRQPANGGGPVADAPLPERRAPQPQDVETTRRGAAELGERGCSTRPQHGGWAAKPDVGRSLDGSSTWLVRSGRITEDWQGWEDGLARVATGVPHRTDRLRALGNAVVPQVAEVVGHRLLAIDAERRLA